METTKINKTIGLLCKLQNLLPRTALIRIYKAFVRLQLQLDFGDIMCDQSFQFVLLTKTRVHSVESLSGNNWRNTGYLQREDLPRSRARVTSITMVV